MSERWVYANRAFLPESQFGISPYDLSVAQGAAAFTMTRSFGKRHWKLPHHLARLQQSCGLLSIPLPRDFDLLPDVIEELTHRNATHFDEQDEYRMMLVVSPGAAKMYTELPGAIAESWCYITMFPLRLTVAGFSKHVTDGIQCVTSPIQQIPDACIPSAAKHRSRLSFHLAQQQAPLGTWPLLTNGDGYYTEAPGANLCYVRESQVFTLEEECLPGISLATVKEFLKTETGGLHCQELRTIDELFLTGTPFCLLPVVSVDGQPIGDGKIGPRYKELMGKWSALVGLDIQQQICEWDKTCSPV